MPPSGLSNFIGINVLYMVTAVASRCACAAGRGATSVQLVPMVARCCGLSFGTIALQACLAMAAKGVALRSRVSGARSSATSTSLMVHIVHLEESVNLCVSGGLRELDMRVLNGAIDLLVRVIIDGDGEVRGGAFGKDF